MHKYRLLLVDDDPAVLQVLEEVFKSEYVTCKASSPREAIRIAAEANNIAVVVMDIKMPGEDGICAAREIRSLDSDISVIFHTGYPGEYDEESLQEDEYPFDYIEKGESVVRLTRSVRIAFEGFLLKKEWQWLCKKAPVNYGLIGASHAMQDVYRLIRRVAASNCKVIILGETGTGKELVAHAIHYNGLRQNEHFAIFSCSHKSPDIIESELFGHIQGAFTSAYSDRVGLFEYANGGSIFLDEIGDLDLLTQGKILRVLETGEYQRVSSPEIKKTDIRVICATHRHLDELVKTGKFREDLYFRLKGVQIFLPPLRERKEDIPLLVERFKDRLTVEMDLAAKFFDVTAIKEFMNYDWPGNVRQLLDTVESLVILTDSDVILGDDVRALLSRQGYFPAESKNFGGLKTRLDEFRRQCILQALAETNNNISAAAQLLGLDRSNLKRMIRALNIQID